MTEAQMNKPWVESDLIKTLLPGGVYYRICAPIAALDGVANTTVFGGDDDVALLNVKLLSGRDTANDQKIAASIEGIIAAYLAAQAVGDEQ